MKLNRERMLAVSSFILEVDLRALVSAVPFSLAGVIYIDRCWILPSKFIDEAVYTMER